MAPRPSWTGHVRLSLVSVPVVAFTTAAPEGGKVHFRQLHAECHSPIKYQKVCPIHGEVSKDEIVLGYEYEPGHYALVDPAERNAAQGGRERVMTLDTFVDVTAIDPLYFDGGSYFLLPDGKVAERPFAVLAQALESRDCCGIGEFATGEKEQLMLVRSHKGLLLLSSLHYTTELKASDTFERELPSVKVTKEELKLAETLIDVSSQQKFDLAKYEDDYTSRLQQIVQSKIAGKEIVSPVAEEPPAVLNLMDALKKSVASKKKAEKPVPVRAMARKTRRKVS